MVKAEKSSWIINLINESIYWKDVFGKCKKNAKKSRQDDNEILHDLHVIEFREILSGFSMEVTLQCSSRAVIFLFLKITHALLIIPYASRKIFAFLWVHPARRCLPSFTNYFIYLLPSIQSTTSAKKLLPVFY